MNTRPVLEVIQTPLERTFRVYAHDYPFAYSGWHHHPEYELHLIRRSSGHFYVGTYAGEFGPGNLVMTGPNLPHMWVSGANDRDGDGRIVGRDLVLQLSAGFAERCVAGFSDCAGLAGLLEASRAGIEFSAAASVEAAERMEALLTANGFERMALFFSLLRILQEDRGRKSLSLKGADHECAQPKRLERILAYIAENFNRPDLSCREVARRRRDGAASVFAALRTTHQVHLRRIHKPPADLQGLPASGGDRIPDHDDRSRSRIRHPLDLQPEFPAADRQNAVGVPG